MKHTKKDGRRIEVLIVRDPDASTEVTVYIDGETVAVVEEHVDPGAGHLRSEWDEYTESLATNTAYTPAFRDELIAARNAYRESDFILDEPW